MAKKKPAAPAKKKAAPKKEESIVWMTGFKGFNPDWTCRDFQYEIGKEYTTDRAKLCDCGFHFCENPMHVLNHYHLFNKENGKPNKFAMVEAAGVTEERDGDSKRAATHLKVTGEISFPGLVKAAFDFAWSKATKGKKENPEGKSFDASNGDWSTSASNGYWSTSASNGYGSTSASNGDWSTSAANGDRSTSAANGDGSTSASNGDRSTSASNGDGSTSASNGDGSTSASNGYRSTSAANGDGSTSASNGYGATSAANGDGSTSASNGDGSTSASNGDRSTSAANGAGSSSSVDGIDSVALAHGIKAKAKGAIGSWIVVSEWEETDGEWHVKDVKTAKVDGETIKENVFYQLKDGEFVETDA